MRLRLAKKERERRGGGGERGRELEREMVKSRKAY